jgi:hypothetical protein
LFIFWFIFWVHPFLLRVGHFRPIFEAIWNSYLIRGLVEKHDEINSGVYDGKRGVRFEMIQVRLE